MMPTTNPKMSTSRNLPATRNLVITTVLGHTGIGGHTGGELTGAVLVARLDIMAHAYHKGTKLNASTVRCRGEPSSEEVDTHGKEHTSSHATVHESFFRAD